MKFIDPGLLEDDQFRREWSSGDDLRMCQALIGLTMYSDEPAAAFAAILHALATERESLRQCGVTCAGHWFRRFGKDRPPPAARLTELGRAIRASGVEQGVVDDMLSDVTVFCPRLLPLLESAMRVGP